MMSQKKTLLLKEAESEYYCTICMDLMQSPTSCANGHTYCRACIEGWLVKSTKCPVCAKKITIKSVTRVMSLELLIEKLPVRCPNGTLEKELKSESSSSSARTVVLDHNPVHVHHVTESCQWTGLLNDVEDHLKECQFENVNCPNKGCKADKMQRTSPQQRM
jgi:hypothetical protein